MAVMIGQEKCSVLRAAPRLMQILRVLARHKFLGALLGKRHWPSPTEVRETIEELGLTFLKFGQVLAMRRDLLPDAVDDSDGRLASNSRRNNDCQRDCRDAPHRYCRIASRPWLGGAA